MASLSGSERQLEDIKRLLVLLLVKAGSTSEEVGTALGVDSSTVRKMMLLRRVKAATSPKG